MRLGHQQAAQRLAARHRLQEALLLLRRAVSREPWRRTSWRRSPCCRCRRRHRRVPRSSACRRGSPRRAPPQSAGAQTPNRPSLPKLQHRLERHRLVAIPLRGVGDYLAPHHVARHVAYGGLLGGESGHAESIHPVVHGSCRVNAGRARQYSAIRAAMSAASVPAQVPGRRDVRVISLIGVAHGASHYYQLAFVTMLLIVRDSAGLSFADVGILAGIFYARLGRRPDRGGLRGRPLRRAADPGRRPADASARACA